MAQDRRLFLKIKLKQLASEARDIRREEHRQIRRRPRVDESGNPVVKIRPVPNREGKCALEILGKGVMRNIQVFDTKVGDLYWELRRHRIFDVRREARATQLAYAYIRGKHYLSVERGAKTQPDWAAVARMVRKYSDWPRLGDQAFAAYTKLESWINEARMHILRNSMSSAKLR